MNDGVFNDMREVLKGLKVIRIIDSAMYMPGNYVIYSQYKRETVGATRRVTPTFILLVVYCTDTC